MKWNSHRKQSSKPKIYWFKCAICAYFLIKFFNFLFFTLRWILSGKKWSQRMCVCVKERNCTQCVCLYALPCPWSPILRWWKLFCPYTILVCSSIALWNSFWLIMSVNEIEKKIHEIIFVVCGKFGKFLWTQNKHCWSVHVFQRCVRWSNQTNDSNEMILFLCLN